MLRTCLHARSGNRRTERYSFELLPHVPYSPDMTPSDFYLFSDLKYHLRSCSSESDNDVSHVEGYRGAQTADFFQEGNEKLEHWRSKCNEVQGDYVEK